MTALEPGQRVECIDDEFSPKDRRLIPNLPARGRFYTIRGFGHGGRGVGLLLVEIVNPLIWVHSNSQPWRGSWRIEPPFLTARFRLAPPTNIDALLAILEDVKKVNIDA